MKKLILFSFVLLAFISCDEIDDPIPKDIGQAIEYQGTTYIIDQSLGIGNIQGLLNLIDDNTWTTKEAASNSQERFLVVEEFTGHTCINCPSASAELHRLDSINGVKLIPISIHAGGFAVPNGDKYDTDYRVLPHCNIYAKDFTVDAYPSALISRFESTAFRVDKWGIMIDSIIDVPPTVELKLINYYSEAPNLVRVDLGITFKAELSGEHSLQLYMLEDNIRDWQKDIQKGDIPGYNHRHVLRKVVNGTYGTILENIQLNEEIKYQFIFPLESSWKPQDVEAVAFVFNTDPDNSEILQGNAAKVK